MSSGIHKGARRTLPAVLAALVLTTLGVLASAGPAAAHDELIGSDPADGATVEAMPAQITLTFSGPVLADLGGNEVQVTDAAGAALDAGDPVVQDNVVTQALTASASGVVTVAWRVVSEDGHPVSGGFAFTVAAAPSPTPTPTTPTATPATPGPSPTPEPTPSPATSPVPAADQASPVPWIVLGAAVIAAAGGIVYLLVARGRRPPTGPAGGGADR